MALLWMDGFDHYNNPTTDASVALAKVYTVNNSNSILCSTGRYSQSAVYMAPTNKNGVTRIYKAITPTVGTTHLIIGFNIYVYGGTNVFINSGWNDDTNGISIRQGHPSPYALLKCGPNTVANLSYNTWYHIEARVPITTSGSNKYELYLNGATVFSSSSLSFAWANLLYIGCRDDFGHTGYHFALDDLYIMDNTGTTNNARIGTELYVPRIETQFPSSDVTNDFTLVGSTIGNANLTNNIETDTTITAFASRLGLTNVSWNETNPYPAQSAMRMYTVGSIAGDADTSLAHSGTKAFMFGRKSGYTVQAASVNFYIQFDTIATEFSFWAVKSSFSADRVAFNVIVNGTTLQREATSTYQQFTFSLSGGLNTIRITPSTALSSSFAFITDDWQFNYSGQQASHALLQVPSNSSIYLSSTTNGNKILCNISNLKTINDVKGIGFMPLASESVTATTSSYKILANNGGSDTEIGATQSVTGTTTAISSQFFDVNPLTSTAWTASDFNAIKAGVINKT
jgi:hypothetical protein